MADKFNAKLSVSELDFDSIKANLKAYLSTQEQFKDINFEGSGINILMDLLAYNTHYQGFYTNMVANEMFLDSAVRRDSIVSLAKHLGYTPRSRTAPTATVDVYTPTGVSLTDTIDMGTIIKGTQGAESYDFSVMNTTGYTLDSDGATYAPVTLKQGKIETLSYIFDDRTNAKYVIPSVADTSTLTVRVQTSTDDNTGYTDAWTLATDLNTVAKTDRAFHIQEIDDGEFEVYFGDNIVGKKPDNGNIIILQYLNTKGPEGNNIGTSDKEGGRVFSYEGSVVKVKSAASGGADAESTKSIKYYAPKTYSAQDRSVTSKDYEALVIRDYADIESVYVWGGEDNDPPEYGKVFLSIKPLSGLTIDETKKQEIIEDIIKKSNVVTVRPEIIDPDYLFLMVESKLVYDKSLTVLGKESIMGLVRGSIIDYIDNDLEKFDKDLYFSKLTRLMDEASTSLVGNDTTIKLQRRFEPRLNATANYKIEFGNPLYHPHDGHMAGVVRSTGVRYKDDSDTVFTGYLEDDGYGKIQMWKVGLNGVKTLVYYGTTAVGTIDYDTGTIELNNFRPIGFIRDANIKINAQLDEKNVFASRSRILTIDKNDPDAIVLSIQDKQSTTTRGGGGTRGSGSGGGGGGSMGGGGGRGY